MHINNLELIPFIYKDEKMEKTLHLNLIKIDQNIHTNVNLTIRSFLCNVSKLHIKVASSLH